MWMPRIGWTLRFRLNQLKNVHNSCFRFPGAFENDIFSSIFFFAYFLINLAQFAIVAELQKWIFA